MGRLLANLITMTTYGTWLRGDQRGWVDEGIVFPADPVIEEIDRKRMKHSEYLFSAGDWWQVGEWMGTSLVKRLALRICAMTVQRWHVHVVAGASSAALPDVAKCAKDAVRWGLRPGRPIWGAGFDKRYCFTMREVLARIEYVERHNLAAGRPAKPWAFIVPPI